MIKKYQHYVINSISITRNKNVEYDNKNKLLRKLARGEKKTNKSSPFCKASANTGKSR